MSKPRVWKAVVVAGAIAMAPGLVFAKSSEPPLKGAISLNVGTIGGRERRYALYVPADLKPGSPLVFVFHGGGGDGPLIRQSTGFEFDMLADANGFVVVYPDGVGQGWNTCRKRVNSDATRLHVDDIAFIEAIIAQEAARHGIDRKRVFATGHSFGGQMAFRLALERPAEFAGVAAISSNLPVAADNGCTPAEMSIPVMIMNGTDDPVSPYRGGRSRGGAAAGSAMSTEATAAYFAQMNGVAGPAAITKLPHKDDSDPTWVEMSAWTKPGGAPVVLYTVHGGGHVVPQPYYRFPNNVGRQTRDLDAPAVIWDFFAGLARN